MLRSASPPTQLIAMRTRDTEVSDQVAQEVLDLALRMGEALISTGAPVADVTAAVLRVAAGYGLTSCQVDITFTSITLSVVRDDGDPMTVMRIVKYRATDYTRLADLYDLAGRAARGLPLVKALAELDEIVYAPHPYRRWMVTGALAMMAAAVCGLLGGGWEIAVVGAATTAGIDRMLRRLNQWGLPTFFQQAAGAAVVTCVAVLLYVVVPRVPFSLEALRPSLVVAAGIMVLLAGLTTVGAAEDAISGHYLTAAARTFEVALLTLGIVVGIGAVLDIAQRYGVPLTVVEATHSTLPLSGQIGAAAVVAGAWSIASYAKPWAVLVVTGTGALAFSVYSAVRVLGIGPAVASGIAAFVVGVAAEVVGSRVRVPSQVVSICGIVPLLPGLSVYQGMFVLVGQSDGGGVVRLITAASIGLALAAGVALGEFVATPLRTGMDRWDQRVRRRARAARD